ncbi:MAG: hypothetical protein ACLR8L_16265 [Oscillospiraceae bacterium]
MSVDKSPRQNPTSSLPLAEVEFGSLRYPHPQRFDERIQDPRDRNPRRLLSLVSRKWVGPKTKALAECRSFEEFYDNYLTQLRAISPLKQNLSAMRLR